MNKEEEYKQKFEYREIDIPSLIKAIRKEEGLTQKEFGKLFGFAESATSMWESGKREAPYKVLEFVFSKWIDGRIEMVKYEAVLEYILSLGWQDTDNELREEFEKKVNELIKKLSKLLKEEE